MTLLIIFFRWLHIISACAVIGGTLFIRLILPRGLALIEQPELRQAVFLKCRRGFKMVIHPSILFLLVSGIFNTWRNWAVYSTNPAAMHPLWGMHLLLALVAITIALYVLAGVEPPAMHRKWVLANLVILAVVVALGSTLKWARENKASRPAALPVDARLNAAQ